ncbi:MAG: glycosyltransferase family 2 protein, partial [Thermoanaerobaculia bacterium]
MAESARPALTIGLPVYNGARFLREALESLLAQTFRDFELVVSDNASTDDTAAICAEYARRDARIRYMRQSTNIGLLANFRSVLDAASGEFFTWAAYDDTWDPEWLEQLVATSARHRCLSYGLLQKVDERASPLHDPANHRRLEFLGTRWSRRLRYFVQPSFLGKYQRIYGVVPTAELKAIRPFEDETNLRGSDLLLLYDLLARIEIRHGGEVRIFKRVHEDCAGAGGDAKRIRHPRAVVRWARFAGVILSSTHLKRYLARS